ncbi:met-zincin domain-containing protein [Trichoderma breve]|uniref:Met-zincin domain-containing protein n=1 Tax=Trichoderma breve TaxID=2034170 RepID=A0A9W9BM78_9HYPO|nr:met-zincin domain-containing protein [Trichoderma breve]KAJ4862321.1 met-zincin domain-containing protein [Trichoderma breve]
MDNDEDQVGGVLTAAKTFNNTTARYIRRELCLVRATAAKYKCATQTHGCAEIRIGWDGEIPRWRRGSELSYVVCIESFPAPLSSMVEDSMKAAIGMWNDIGVSFKQVARNDPATFAVIYENRNRNAYACSFFPNELSRELIIYPPSLQKTNHLSNILAHEVGHILGLRHEFAHKREKGLPSALFGSENADSIMNYFDHPEQLQVREQDLEELECFYAYDEVQYGKLLILDVNPEVWFLGKIMAMTHDTDLLPELH